MKEPQLSANSRAVPKSLKIAKSRREIIDCFRASIETLEKNRKRLKNNLYYHGRRNQYAQKRIRALMYLPIYNGNVEVLSLVDSGAQVNLVREDKLQYLEHYIVLAPEERIGGVGGGRAKIKRWIELKLNFDGKNEFTTLVGVVDSLDCGVLLGLPFLFDIDAVIHIRSQYITSNILGDLVLQNKQPKQTIHNASVLAFPIEVMPPSCLETSTEDSDEESAIPKIEEKKTEITEDEKRKMILARTDAKVINEDQREKIIDLLLGFPHLWMNKKIGSIIEVHHHIQLNTTQPIVSRPRYYSETQQKIIKDEVDSMLKKGIIQLSNSEYSSEIVLVLKKTGEWRFCIDFRPLNAATIDDRYPLPLIRDLLQSVKQSTWFTSIDLRSGYWQIPMAEGHEKYTAFRCNSGLYEHKVMPFGLKNAPATFQRCMDFILKDLRVRGISGVSVYLDDILIFATTFEECYQLTMEVLERLSKVQLTINLDKSQFFFRELKYLGHILGNGLLTPDRARVELLKKRKKPTTITDVRSLIGFIGYYQSFIKDFARLMQPAYELFKGTINNRKKNQTTKITWTDQLEMNVEEAITQLMVSVLTIPLEGEEFVMETDASDSIVGAVLYIIRDGEKRPVEFFSKVLTATERKWPTRDKEAFAIITGVQKFDRFIRGRSTLVNTDHQSLKWLFEATKGRIARWACLLSEYTLKVQHIKGSDNVAADFLTRHIDVEADPLEDRMLCFCTSVLVNEPRIPTLDEIKTAQQEELKTQLLLHAKGYTLQEDLVYYHNLIYIPSSLRGKIIQACHSLYPMNHPGQKKTLKTVNKLFNWPGCYHDIVRYINSCLICQRMRIGKERKQGKFTMHATKEIMSKVYMDFYTVTFQGQTARYLTLIDSFSKWAECIEVTPHITSPEVVARFLEDWVFRFGVPKFMVSDNDITFVTMAMDQCLKILKIHRTLSTPWHPEGNATIESFHRVLNRGLRNFHGSSLDVQSIIKLIMFSYRVTPHSSTANSPFYLLYGFDPSLFPDTDWRQPATINEMLRLRFLTIQRLEVQLKANYLYGQQVKRQNEERSEFEFEEGQLVLFNHPSDPRHKYIVTSAKAYPIWSIPYRVVKVLHPPQHAQIRDLITGRVRTVHCGQCRVVEKPAFNEQYTEWAQMLAMEIVSFYDTNSVADILDNFFADISRPSNIEEPTVEIEELPRPIKFKRRRPTKRRNSDPPDYPHHTPLQVLGALLLSRRYSHDQSEKQEKP